MIVGRAYVASSLRPKERRIMCTSTRVAVHADARPGMSTQRFCEDLSGEDDPHPHEIGEISSLCQPVAERVDRLLAACRAQWPGQLIDTGKTLTCSTLKTDLPQVLSPIEGAKIASLGWNLAARKGSKHILTRCACRNKEAFKAAQRAKAETVLMGKHDPLPSEIHDLVSRVAAEIVPCRWDALLPKTRVYIPTTKATLETPSSKGGHWIKQSRYHNDSKLEVMEDGRVITIFGQRRQSVLRPLHESLYESLSKYRWLKRGEFTPSDVSELMEVSPKHEIFISGDYTASTDNIRTEVLEIIVAELREKASLLSDEEERALLEFPHYSIGGRTANRGSPMGSYLSFPILCIANRLAFEIACITDGRMTHRQRVKKRVRINGDDIIFRGDRTLALHWKEAARIIGFVVNDEKTGISSRVAELNSTAVAVLDGGALFRVPRIPVKLVCGDIANSDDYAKLIADSGLREDLVTSLVKENFTLVTQSPMNSILELKRMVAQPVWRAVCRSHSTKAPVSSGNYFGMLEVEEPLTFEDGERERRMCQRIEEVREIVASEAISPWGLRTRRRKAVIESREKSKGPLASFTANQLRKAKPRLKPTKALMEFAFLVHDKRVEERFRDVPQYEPAQVLPASNWGGYGSTIDIIAISLRSFRSRHTPVRVDPMWDPDVPDLEWFE